MTAMRWAIRTIDAIVRTAPSAFISAPKNDEGYKLSPLLHVLLGLKKKSRSPLLSEGSPAEGREQYRKDVMPLSARFKVRDTSDFIISMDKRNVSVRHYTPFELDSIPALLIYFHGGGYVIGDLDTHDDICRLICQKAGLQVLSVDYGLAPEHPFPKGIEEAASIVKWVQRNAKRFSIEERAVLVGGDSAGATIAAAIANILAKTPHALLAQLLIYPGTDRSANWGSYEQFGYDYFLNLADRDWFYSHYIKNSKHLAEDTRISPLKFEFDTPATPGIIITAGFDVLRDEGRAYADRLKSSQENISHFHFGSLTHGFVNLIGVHQASRKASIKFSEALGKLVATLIKR